MQFAKQSLSIAAACVIAVGAGHFVQNKDMYLGTTRASATPLQPVVAVTDTFVNTVQPLSATTDDAPTSIFRLGDMPSLPAMSMDLTARVNSDHDHLTLPASANPAINEYGLPCEANLTLTPETGGLVAVSLIASCLIDSPVTLQHDELVFSARTDHIGRLDVTIPAMDGDATVEAILDTGDTLSAMTSVPDATDYDRIALQWVGDQAMGLHAFEFGAAFGDTGHVWAENPRSTTAHSGGFLTRLGTGTGPAAQFAEVYSFPKAQEHLNGVVRMSVEVAVTDRTCGAQASAEILQPGANGHLQASDIVLDLPGCDAVGEFLVLKNIVRDLKLAAN